MKFLNKSCALFTPFALLNLISADTCAFCRHDDLIGEWKVEFSAENIYSQENRCFSDTEFEVAGETSFTFYGENNVRHNGYNSEGDFTLIYKEAFEARVAGRRWWAWFYFADCGTENQEYDCSKTMTGITHDLQAKEWACFRMTKLNSDSGTTNVVKGIKDLNSEREISYWNKLSWTEHQSAVNQLGFFKVSEKEPENPIHPSLIGKPKQKREEGERLPLDLEGTLRSVEEAKLNVEQNNKNALNAGASILPENWDWDALGFDSPQHPQGQCGSCFTFASINMLENRARVSTNNTWKPLFSQQDPLSCHPELSQACDGGFAYMIAGKYANEFGVIDNECFTYKQALGPSPYPCQPDIEGCTRYKVSEYEYVAGYYKTTNEYDMRRELYNNGAMAIGVDTSLLSGYEGGIVVPLETFGFDPLYQLGHAVTIIGYGVEDGIPFWKVKNSWGVSWGEKGYFRILRGGNVAGVEASPFKATIIPPF